MPDDKNIGKDDNLTNNSPPTEQDPKTDGDAAKGESGKEGGGILTDIIDTVKDTVKDKVKEKIEDKANDLLGTDSGKGKDSDKDAGGKAEDKDSNTETKDKNAADTSKEEKGGIVEEGKSALDGVKNAVGTDNKGGASQPSLADQMKELDEVQIDKAFVEDSLNLLDKLSFDKLIGNPLRAAIKAQRDLAKETLSYIREEGIKVDKDGQGQIIYVTMNFVRDGKQVKMRVPLLTLMPVPRLSITSMNYTFKAKVDAISSVVASVGSGGTPVNTTFGLNSNDKSAKPSSSGGGAQKPSTDKGGAAGQNAKQAEAETKSNPKATLSASYSSKKDSGATRDSRYSVETTMDVTITASEGEMPRGIDKLLGVLNESTEVIDPNGILQVSTEQVSLVNGYAAISVNYRDEKGAYQPTAVKCVQLNGKKTPTLLQSGDNMLLVFSEKGTYNITAGKLQRIVFVS